MSARICYGSFEPERSLQQLGVSTVFGLPRRVCFVFGRSGIISQIPQTAWRFREMILMLGQVARGNQWRRPFWRILVGWPAAVHFLKVQCCSWEAVPTDSVLQAPRNNKLKTFHKDQTRKTEEFKVLPLAFNADYECMITLPHWAAILHASAMASRDCCLGPALWLRNTTFREEYSTLSRRTLTYRLGPLVLQ